MLEHRNDRFCIFMADSLADAVSWLDRTPRLWNQKASVGDRPSHDWDANAGWEGALRLGRDGWDAGVQDLHGKLEAMVRTVTEKQPPWRYDVAGALPDVPRFLAGAPDPMMNHGKTKGKKPTVHIVVDVCVSSMATSRQIMNYGTALTALIDEIEHSGKRVQLDAVALITRLGGGYGGGKACVMGWTVKRASEPCDLSAVAFSLAHPAAFRRLMFGMVERTPLAWDTHGYGSSIGTLKAEYLQIMDAEQAFCIEGVKTDARRCSTIEGALELAQEQLAAAEAAQLRMREAA
jgi:hypothetical protein